MRRIMRKKLASFMNSKYILIGLSALCLLFIATSFFTDKLTTPASECHFNSGNSGTARYELYRIMDIRQV